MKKSTLASRVFAFLKTGDEGKLNRFELKVEKFFTKQIDQRKEAIKSLQEKIEDKQEELNDTILAVNLDKINSTEGAESYVVTYVRAVQAKEDEVEYLQDQIETIEKEIARLEKTQSTLYSVEEA